MKRVLFYSIFILSMAMSVGFCSENLMPRALVSGPFSALNALSDTITETISTVAVSDVVGGKSLRLVIDLQSLSYLKELRIYWDKAGVPLNYSVWLSKSNVDNEVIGGLDGTSGQKSESGFNQVVPLSSAYARYVTIFIPADVVLNAGNQIRIKELEIIKEDNPQIVVSGVQFLPGDQEASIVFKTNIDAKSQIFYSQDAAGASPLPPLRFIRPRKEHSGVVYGLSPDTRYKFWVEVSSPVTSGVISSEYYEFTTKKTNLAFGKSVTGSFTSLPADRYVKPDPPASSRLTDNRNDYFSSLALSGSVLRSDQYAILDLGANYEVSQVLLYWWALSYSKAFSVLVSIDGVKWDSVGSGLDASCGLYTTTGSPMYVYEHKFLPVKARYLKILVPQNSAYFVKQDTWDFVSLFEIKVF